MKVLIITNAFPNHAEKTRGIFTYQIVKALQKKCDVEVVAPLPWVPPFLKKKCLSKYPHALVPVKEKIEEIQVYHPRYLVIPKILGFMHGIFMFPALFRLIKRLERRQHFDLINAQWIFPDGVAATWVGKILKKPVVLTALGCDINLYSTMMLRKLQISSVLRQADEITTKSSALKKMIAEMDIPNEKVTVIPNGVDLGLFRIMEKKKVRTGLGIPDGKPVFLTVCSLDEVKGINFLIDALKIIRDRTTIQPLLYIIGHGPLKKNLFFQANSLGVAETVFFLGEEPYEHIPYWMNATDVFCLPSLREGYPNVVIEALACGIPVVASDVGGIPEIISERNGRIAKAGDPVSLCDQLLFCLMTSWNRIAIRETVDNYSWQDCAEKYMSHYVGVIEEKGLFP